MGKARKLKKAVKKHGKTMAKTSAATAVAAKVAKKDKKPKRGGAKKVILSAALMAGAYAAAKKLGMFEDDEVLTPSRPTVVEEKDTAEDYV